jgi:hypothetical protein
MYQNFDELIRAFATWREKQDDIVRSDDPVAKEFRRLFIVYYDAQDNPPEGIIGVGAITYAEHKLREAQL